MAKQLAAKSKKCATAVVWQDPKLVDRRGHELDAYEQASPGGPTTLVKDKRPTRDQLHQAVAVIQRREQYLNQRW